MADDVATEGQASSVSRALGQARCSKTPFRHWLADAVLPPELIRALVALPCQPPTPAGATREADNPQRRYCDPEAMRKASACGVVADVFQSRPVTAALSRLTGARLEGSFLRIEFANDIDGFWLKPHRDMAVKRLTLQIYLAGGDPDLGTDLYRGPDQWAARAPFVPGLGLAFVPAMDTWHGFEPRSFRGVRRSLIVNYVDDSWRERGQLAFPDRPITGVAAANRH